MSQFLLCLPRFASKQVRFRSIGSVEPWLTEAAEGLGLDRRRVRVPMLEDGRDAAVLFDDAYGAVQSGKNFDLTDLGVYLPELFRSCDSIATWWAGEWSGLIVAPDSFIEVLVTQLREPVGDAYVRWDRDLPTQVFRGPS
jgi:hypothetical protein